MERKSYKIKDIAKLAGVSVGTVDRVLHNRGDVSRASRQRIQDIIKEIDYEPNLLISSIGIKRQFSIVVILPEFSKGEYWEQIAIGVKNALYDFSQIKLKVKSIYYDQFDIYSCQQAYNEALSLKCDAMVIGPTFAELTLSFTSTLEQKNIPYIYVDSFVEKSNPIAFFGPNSQAIGNIEAKLLCSVMDNRKDIAIFQAVRIGNESSLQSVVRKEGFLEYINENHIKGKIVYGNYYNSDINRSWNELDAFFAKNNNIGGAVVFNSRAYIVSSYLAHHNITQIKLVGCGAVEKNLADLRSGHISYLLSERADRQGYMSIKAILEYLLFGKEPNQINYTPIDIIIKESIDYYITR